MRNVSDKSCRENPNTHFMSNNIFFFLQNFAVYDSVEKYGRAGQTTDDSMAHAHCMRITMATDTHSEYVILIAFPSQQWLRERASILRYTYIVRLVYCSPKCNSFDVLVIIVFLSTVLNKERQRRGGLSKTYQSFTLFNSWSGNRLYACFLGLP